MSESNHSAEFYRGALSVLEGRPCTAEYYRNRLAEAEAREAIQGNQEKMALSRIHAIASRQLAEPTGAGDAVAMAKICTEVEAVQLPSQPTQPTAAEVIEAAQESLEYLEVAPFEHCIEHDQEGCRGCASNSANAALALIARYKEANGGK